MTNTTRGLSTGDAGQPALQQMAAEVMLYDDASASPREMDERIARATEALNAYGFKVRPFETWADPYSNTRWLLAWTMSRLDVDGFWRSVTDIVAPMNGEVLIWGLTSNDELAAWQARDGG
jgi:hypothetical protein